MSRFSEEELAKLPKWAQGRISALVADVEHYKREAVQVATGVTDVWIWDSEGYRALPSGSLVSFTTDQDPLRHDQRFDVRRGDGDSLIVSGGDSIAVRPVAGNVVRITILGPGER